MSAASPPARTRSPVETMLRDRLAAREALTNADLAWMLRLLAKWRSQMIAGTIVARDGPIVQSGPFAGLVLGPHATEGGHAPRLLGCYEHELHAEIERLAARGFHTVLNIGCAEGYYAIGLARRMPGARVFAHDANPGAQALCRRLAEDNGVADRVAIGGLFRGEDFARFAEADTLLVLDIEGGEDTLLDPAAWPALRRMTVLVECHEMPGADMAGRIAERFASSHRIRRIGHALAAPELPPWLAGLDHLDRLLATWEWRSIPTPWLVMEPA